MDQERQKYSEIYTVNIIMAYALLLLNIYIFAHPFFEAIGWSHPVIRQTLAPIARSEYMRTPFTTKAVFVVLSILIHTIRTGRGKETSWVIIILALLAGGGLFFWWPHNYLVYVATSLAGALTLSWCFASIGRNLAGFKRPDNDVNETFPQCEELIETPDSINFRIKYQYQKKKRIGYANVVNPFRATMILGTPGSGKSFSVYNPFIEQMIQKDYVMFVYDYKFPDLTEIVYNEMLRKYPPVKNPDYGKVEGASKLMKDPKAPSFFVINFNDPEYSHRCNPIHASYIQDPADSAEIAEIIMKNVAPGTVEKEDFFSMSAKVYLDAIVYFLSIYKGGIYCTFPHVIELMGCDYKKVFAILSTYEELETKIKPFAEALKAGAQDQLQGQIASATIPLNKMASPALYWVLSGDDFLLDINNPDDPKIVCVGNDPNRQAIYGTTLALITSRLFKLVNKKGKRKCGVLLDELPTIFIKGLDNLIATARSNKVAIVAGAQDKSQLIRDYSEKEANVIFNTVGNIFSGQVNGKTAEDLSRSFGKEFREQQSQTQSLDSDSVQISFHEQEIMPVSKIETLTQGFFFGKVADNNDTRIERKFFCGEIDIDVKRWLKKLKSNRKIPRLTDFGEEEINAQVHEKTVRDELIRRHVSQLVYSTAESADPDYIDHRMEAVREALTDQEIEDILMAEAKELTKKQKEKMVKDNYNLIRQQVRDLIFDELGVSEDYTPNQGGRDDEDEPDDDINNLMK